MTSLIHQLAGIAPVVARAATRSGARVPDTDVTMRRLLMYVLLLVVAGVVLILLTIWFRRQFLGGPQRTLPEGTVFSLSDLRQLRADGLISQQEYEQTRDKIVQVAQKSLADAADDADKPPIDAPRTKDVDLIRDAER